MAAGFAGIINAPISSLTPEVGEQILVQTFVVVVIGGLQHHGNIGKKAAELASNPAVAEVVAASLVAAAAAIHRRAGMGSTPGPLDDQLSVKIDFASMRLRLPIT